MCCLFGIYDYGHSLTAAQKKPKNSKRSPLGLAILLSRALELWEKSVLYPKEQKDHCCQLTLCVFPLTTL